VNKAAKEFFTCSRFSLEANRLSGFDVPAFATALHGENPKTDGTVVNSSTKLSVIKSFELRDGVILGRTRTAGENR
jgi:hypothetical protein